MLQLFPVYKKRILLNAGIWIGFMAAFSILFAEVSPIVIFLAAVIGVGVVILFQYTNAIQTHNRILNILYNQLDVNSFMKHYAPLLEVPLKSAQLHVMLRLHMSNAYCAQGRFKEAIDLLTHTEIRKATPEQQLVFRFSIISNLCYCAQQMNDLETARRYLDELLTLKMQLVNMQENKPAKKRMTFSTDLNEQCMKFLETGKADVEFLRTQVQNNNTQQLHRITTSLWIARAYLSENNRREAEKLLKRIVELAPNLYPGKCAKELLDQLPAKEEKNV